ncbi:hypothetical protein SS50377_23486 [Spironucleus salmonicida]|uniref:Uncharacterized protein n=1 Tax=Spironucleus salmonicida TaxID=348837 RepID=V6LPR1_9EUKA|nr:hypothetical protein SS50377_23486 [Spironucleus salmonicida]|eukprot:EST46223.1 hypothetical protein SS50377_13819 [Spironucleus salmonicida]
MNKRSPYHVTDDHFKQTFSISTKLNILDWMAQDSKRTSYQASKYFNINSKTIRNWKKQEPILRRVRDPDTVLRVSKHQKFQQQDLIITPSNSLKSSEVDIDKQQESFTAQQCAANQSINITADLASLLEAMLRNQ